MQCSRLSGAYYNYTMGKSRYLTSGPTKDREGTYATEKNRKEDLGNENDFLSAIEYYKIYDSELVICNAGTALDANKLTSRYLLFILQS